MAISIFQKVLKKSRDTWFSQAMRLFDSASIGDEVWEELEELLVSADVGVTTTEDLIAKVKDSVGKEKVTEGSGVRAVLRQEMANMLEVPPWEKADGQPVPEVILVVGVNGGGKTTSIAKLACKLKKQGKKVMLAAADTFRAAAIDQLKRQGERVGVDVIAHQPDADPGAVVFDAIQAAESRQADVLIIDTAGRLHTKFNLMEELKKVKRVAAKSDSTAPHEIILVLDATTGRQGRRGAGGMQRVENPHSIHRCRRGLGRYGAV